MRKEVFRSIPAKLNLRQIFGSLKSFKGLKIGRFYEKCPQSRQIPLRKIFNQEIFMQGHVAIGFTEDGKYFLTYVCNIKFQISDTSACSYQYKLFWWKFDLWKPLKKVHEVQLFAHEQIPNEVHLKVCQDRSSSYMVVHGSLINTDSQSNGKMCYISVIPNYESKDFDHCLHFKYELLPPHPPFIASLLLKLPNVILMNSGDMLICIMLNKHRDVGTTFTGSGMYCKDCYCLQKKGQNNASGDICGQDDTTDFISYIRQGYTSLQDGDSNDTLPSSPFDCTATVIPCTITTLNGDLKWRNVFEHRCFRRSDKGCLDRTEYYISQAQFDAENFMNTELQKHDDISKRLVSLRDYDMQLVEVCPWTNEVIILINALIVLHDPMKNDQMVHRRSSSIDTMQGQKPMKLVLYTVGYILSWNVFTGAVNVLKSFPLAEGPGNICKSRQFTPSLSQAVQLRKSWSIPSNKTSSLHVLSNHTVFTGQSLEFLFHPEFPVAVVL